MRVAIGPLDIEAGGMRVRRFGVWLPDGLHVWFGSRGVHLFWSKSEHAGRITVERETP